MSACLPIQLRQLNENTEVNLIKKKTHKKKQLYLDVKKITLIKLKCLPSFHHVGFNEKATQNYTGKPSDASEDI